MHQETSTPTAIAPVGNDTLLTPAQMDELISALRARGETWTVRRIEEARKGFEPMTVNEILDAFGDPKENEEKAVLLLHTIIGVTTPHE